METFVNGAVEILVEKMNKTVIADEILKLSQAALNLAQTKSILEHLNK